MTAGLTVKAAYYSPRLRFLICGKLAEKEDGRGRGRVIQAQDAQATQLKLWRKVRLKLDL